MLKYFYCRKSKRKKHRRAKVVELKLKKWGLALVNIFDLHLLKDSKYVILMLGLSIAIFAEINFSLHTPFILGEMGYSTQQIAVVLSCLASADIVFRFVSPFIGDYFNQTPRIMYLYSLGLLVITRTCMIFSESSIAMNKTEYLNIFSNLICTKLWINDCAGSVFRYCKGRSYCIYESSHPKLCSIGKTAISFRHSNVSQRCNPSSPWTNFR